MRSTHVYTASLIAALAAPASAAAKPTITMSGSTSVAPLAAKLARKYAKVCHKCVRFRLRQGGSDVGIADVAGRRVTIGNSSRDREPGDPRGLVFNKIARDAICLISNRANPVPSLSKPQVQRVYSGAVRDWRAVSGARISGPIDLFVRPAASGTHDAFEKIFMKPVGISPTVSERATNGLVQQAVQRDRQGIGYVSLAFTRGTHPIKYQGVACNLRNAKSGRYRGTRNFWMVTRGPARGAAKKWIRWIQRSPAAAEIIATEWVPLR